MTGGERTGVNPYAGFDECPGRVLRFDGEPLTPPSTLKRVNESLFRGTTGRGFIDLAGEMGGQSDDEADEDAQQNEEDDDHGPNSWPE